VDLRAKLGKKCHKCALMAASAIKSQIFISRSRSYQIISNHSQIEASRFQRVQQWNKHTEKLLANLLVDRTYFAGVKSSIKRLRKIPCSLGRVESRVEGLSSSDFQRFSKFQIHFLFCNLVFDHSVECRA
jgi:hypothetical protein